MPVVNIPPLRQDASKNVTPWPDGADQSHLIYHLAVGLAAVVLVITLRSRKRARQSPTVAKKPYGPKDSAPPVSWQKQTPSTAPLGKSRGISSNLVAASTVMSDDHRGPDPSRGNGHEIMDPGRVEHDLGDSAQDQPGAFPSISSSPIRFGNPPWARTARPPPRSPKVPLAVTTDAMKLEDRRLSSAVSTIGDVDLPLFQRQGFDYTSSPSSSSVALPTRHGSPLTPRRRSYTRTISLGDSLPDTPPAELPDTPPVRFAPSSFPSSSPYLPPAPHDGGEGGGDGDGFPPQEINVHGEIVSMEDSTGASWTRHTRVYGGGVCLACLAAGGEGGFYGPKVPLKDRR